MNDTNENKLDLYMELRKLVLGLHRKDTKPEDMDKVNAVLVDTNDGRKTFSVAAVIDGNCSLYFDNGQYIIGLGKDPDIADAAKQFASKAVESLPDTKPVTDTEILPEPFYRTFYLITDGGIYRTIAPTDSPMGMPPAQMHLTSLLSALLRAIHNSPALKQAEG